MSRIPYLAETAMDAHQRRRAQELLALRGRPVSGPGAFWLYNPYLSECAEPLRQHMEGDTSLPKALSELAMLAAARHWSARYAWCRHEHQAIEAGIDAGALAELRADRAPAFADESAALVYAVARSLLTTGRLDDGVYARALDRLGLPALVELVAEVGYGTLISLANVTFEPDPPNGAIDFLPPGAARPTPPVPLPAGPARRSDAASAAPPGLIGAAAIAWRRDPIIVARAAHYEETFLNHLTLAPSVSRLLFLRIARYWSAESLWPGLAALAVRSGLDAKAVDDVAQGRRPRDLDASQAVASDFVEVLLAGARPDDAIFARAREILGYSGMVELPAIVGFMTMVALTANVFASRLGAAHAID